MNGWSRPQQARVPVSRDEHRPQWLACPEAQIGGADLDELATR